MRSLRVGVVLLAPFLLATGAWLVLRGKPAPVTLPVPVVHAPDVPEVQATAAAAAAVPRVAAEAASPIEPPRDRAATTPPELGLALAVTVIRRDEGAGEVPVAAARVRARFDGPFDSRSGSGTILEATTDASGSAILEFPTEGTVALTATAEGRHAFADPKHYGPGRHTARLELEHSFRVRGQVADAVSRAPVAGARVRGIARSRLGLPPTITDADGSFVLDPWTPGAVSTLSVEADGYGSEAAMIHVATDGSWHVPARFGRPESRGSADPFVTIFLVPEKTVRGSVVDPDGAPLRGVPVTARGSFLYFESVLRPDEASTTTNADGRFELRGLRSDTTHGVIARSVEHGAAVAISGARRTEDDVGPLVLESANEIRGVVRDAADTPVAGVRATLRLLAPTDQVPDRSAHAGHNPMRDGWSSQSTLHEDETLTETDGTYVFRSVPAGRVRIVVHPRPHRSDRLDALGTGDDQTIEPLVVDEPIPRWTGHLTRNGLPLPGAAVHAATPRPTRFELRAKSDAEGSFTFSGPVAETYLLLRIEAEGDLRHHRRIRLDAPELELDL